MGFTKHSQKYKKHNIKDDEEESKENLSNPQIMESMMKQLTMGGSIKKMGQKNILKKFKL